MSAALLIQAAAADGLYIGIGASDKLKLVGNADAVNRWRERIAARKPDILAALRATEPALAQPPEHSPALRVVPDADTMADDFEERAAIIEEGDRLPRAEAERCALLCVYCRRCSHYRPANGGMDDGIGQCAVRAWERSRYVRRIEGEPLCDSWAAA